MKNHHSKILFFTLLLTFILPLMIEGQVKYAKSASNKKITQQTQADDLVFSREGFVYFLPALADQPQRIVKGEFPSFDRAKQQIVYVRPQLPVPDAEAVLMIYDLNTRKSRELYSVKGFVNALQYAPEGGLILFVLRTLDGKTKLEIFNTMGEESFTINESNKEIDDVFAPVWAANGNIICFHDMTTLFQVSFDGRVLKTTPLEQITGSLKTVTSSDRYIPSPTDEDLMVFTQLVSGTKLFENIFGEPNTALFIYDKDQNKRTRLTPENMFAFNPVWSQNGDTLYFTGYYDINGRESYPFRIFSIKKDGSHISEISKGEGPDL